MLTVEEWKARLDADCLKGDYEDLNYVKECFDCLLDGVKTDYTQEECIEIRDYAENCIDLLDIDGEMGEPFGNY